MTINPQIKKFTISVLLVLPALISFVFIAIYGVNVVFWDQWDFVPLFDKLYSGSLTFSDLIAQHNEHRFLVYRVIMLTLGSITHYNNIAEMYFSWFLLCLICFVLYKIYTISSGFSWSSAARFIPVTWLMFNLRQFENLLFGIQIAFFMLILSFLLVIYLLQTSKGLDWRFYIAIICGIVGTFSVSNGLLIWLIGLLQILCILLSKTAGRKWAYIGSLGVWTAATVAITIFFFWDYHLPPWHSSLFSFIQQPLIAAAYGLAALGTLFSIQTFTDILATSTAIIAGTFLVVSYITVGIVILKNVKVEPSNLTYLSLILFTLLSVVSLVVGRSGLGLGIEQALSSRYLTFTIMAIIGLYLAIVSFKFKFINLKSLAFRAPVSLLILFLLSLNIYLLVIPRQVNLNRRLVQQYLMTYQVQSDENLKSLYPDPEIVKKYAPILEKYNLNVFYQSR